MSARDGAARCIRVFTFSLSCLSARRTTYGPEETHRAGRRLTSGCRQTLLAVRCSILPLLIYIWVSVDCGACCGAVLATLGPGFVVGDWCVTGKKTPGGAGTHTGHAGAQQGTRKHTDHTVCYPYTNFSSRPRGGFLTMPDSGKGGNANGRAACAAVRAPPPIFQRRAGGQGGFVIEFSV